jgi:hypothetical protein
MERQLDGVKVRRILRQEPEACANIPESLIDTGDPDPPVASKSLS